MAAATTERPSTHTFFIAIVTLFISDTSSQDFYNRTVQTINDRASLRKQNRTGRYGNTVYSPKRLKQ